MKRLFIHIPKNGGSTIKSSPYTKNSFDVVVPKTVNIALGSTYLAELTKAMSKLNGTKSLNVGHARWKDIQESFKREKRSFAIIRNPWSRTVSRYRWATKLLQLGKMEKTHGNFSSFESFIEDRYVYGNIEYFWHRAVQGWFSQLDYVSNEDGKIVCDIMRFEHMDKDVCRYLNIETLGRPRNVTFKSTGVYTNYQKFYTPKTIQIVADWYKDDIDYWGFDFDSTATRNTTFS